MATAVSTDQPRGPLANPWLQLVAGIICMAAVANYQYGWTYFVPAMQDANGWSNANIQWAFTFFVTLEVWIVPIEGPLVDKYGPKLLVLFGGIIAGLGWIINAHAGSVQMLWVGNAVAGIGAGMVYGTCIGNAVKWFGARRGLAAGLTSMGFGIGAAFTVAPILHMIKVSGYAYTFQFFGIAQAIIVVIVSLVLVMPPRTLKAAEMLWAGRSAQAYTPPKPTVLQGTRDYSPGEVIVSPVFWVMFVMFTLVAAGGLTAVAQLASIAKDFYIDQIPVTILVWTQATLAWTGQLNNIVNGLTRPLLGGLSDRLGRENTMFVAFLLEGVGIFLLWKFGTTPLAFVLLAGLVFFAWGEIFSIFPATMRDHFGQKFATTNYGMLYMAKWVGSFGAPIAGYITAATHGWSMVLIIAAIMNIVAALMSILVLKPLRIWDVRRSETGMPRAPSAAPAS
jgi:OFA family oxalate/formate antiporter-like MFS transporter